VTTDQPTPGASTIAPAADSPLLDVRGLRTYFHVMDGTVKAVDGVDFSIPRGGNRRACRGIGLRQERDRPHDLCA